MPGEHPVCCGLTMNFMANGPDNTRLYTCADCDKMISVNGNNYRTLCPGNPPVRVSRDTLTTFLGAR